MGKYNLYKEGSLMYPFWRHVTAAALAVGLIGGSTAWGEAQHADATGLAAQEESTTTSAQGLTSSSQKVNINTADEATLTAVKGIGGTHARAIIEYREQNGPFKSVDELTKIKGIKEKSLSKFKDQLSVE